MSRLARKPIVLPAGVEFSRQGGVVTVKGPKGTLSQDTAEEIEFAHDGAKREVLVTRTSDAKQARAFHGLYYSLVRNMVKGVSEGFVKTLEIQGVGYRAELKGQDLVLHIGFCHPVTLRVPEGVKVECPQPVIVRISGIDKQKVGEFAAVVRRKRPPEPYKGKGIRYQGEYVRILPGKTFTSGG